MLYILIWVADVYLKFIRHCLDDVCSHYIFMVYLDNPLQKNTSEFSLFWRNSVPSHGSGVKGGVQRKHYCGSWGEQHLPPPKICPFGILIILDWLIFRNSIHGRSSKNQVEVTLCKGHLHLWGASPSVRVFLSCYLGLPLPSVQKVWT